MKASESRSRAQVRKRGVRTSLLLAFLSLLLAFPAMAQGAGSISGRVTDESSNPISGMCVATQSPGGLAFATTNGNGDYTLTGLAARSDWKLQFNWCNQPGWTPEYWENTTNQSLASNITVVDGQDTPNISASLVAAATPGGFSGRVTDAGDNPIAGMCVGTQGPGGATHNRTTDANGDYAFTNIPPGEYKVQFNYCNQPDWLTEYYDDTTVQAEADGVNVASGVITPNIDAELAPAARITGTVTAEGSPASAVCVLAVSTTDGLSRQTLTAPDGTYSLAGLPPGGYKLGFSDCFGFQDDWAPQWWDGKPTRDTADPITLATGEVSSGKDADLVEGGRITGNVTAGGSPAQGMCATAELGTSSVAFAQTDANGDYVIAGLGSGNYSVSFADCNPAPPDYGIEWYDDQLDSQNAAAVTVAAPATTGGIDADLVEAGAIEGDLTVAGGAPADRACVGAFRPSANDGFDFDESAGFAISDASGHYRISGLQARQYKVAFGDCEIGFQTTPRHPAYAFEVYSDRSSFATADLVTVTSGGTADVDAELALGGRITGTVTDANGPLAFACVSAEDPSTGEMAVGATTLPDGTYKLPGVPVGDWAIRFSTDGCEEGTATGYAPEYYDDAPDRASADAVTVTADATTAPIDAELADDPDPETQITSGPADGSSSANDDPAFAFESNEASATFECDLDGGGYAPCTSPHAYSNLAPDTYTFSVRAVDDAGQADGSPATRTWTVNPASTSETTEGEVEPGGTVTSDPAGTGATPSQPTTAAVTVPDGGEVTITSQPAGAPPAGFNFLGRQFEIEAPDATEEEPLVLTFVLDASAIPGGTDPQTVQVMRDGAAAGDCTAPVAAAPDPCVASRTLIAGGDLELVVRSSHASTWNLGVAAPAPPGKCRVPLVIGRKLVDAKAKIVQAKCKVGTIRTVRTRLIPKDIVLLQKPLPWLVRPANTPVDIWVSSRN